MKLGIMQPYFLPYIGYWQLINAVDSFVIYDNIQYTKKGWFNRNRFLLNGKDSLFTIPLKKDSNFLDVNERIISPDFNKRKLLSQLQNAYAKAPYKKEIMPFIEDIINYQNDNLFQYIYNSVAKIVDFLDINTNITVSSTININHEYKSKDKVIALCKALNAKTYINPIGGTKLYNKAEFEENGINLKFIKTNQIEYKQFNNVFVPNLSIIDVLMFNSKEEVKEMLNQYKLTDGE